MAEPGVDTRRAAAPPLPPPIPEPALQPAADARRAPATASPPSTAYEPALQAAAPPEPLRRLSPARPPQRPSADGGAEPTPAAPIQWATPKAAEPTPRSPVFQSAAAAKRKDAASQADENNLAEMAHRLEAALRRPTPNRPVEAPVAGVQAAQGRPVGRPDAARLSRVATALEPAAPGVSVGTATPDQAPIANGAQAPGRVGQQVQFESLEDEMASLLSRSTGKT